MIEAVIFDIDGTLVDSNDYHVCAWQEAFRHYGKELGRAEVHAQIGKGGDQLIPVFCTPEEVARFGAALERERLARFTREYLPRVQPFPRVRELFERLRADGLRLALASSSKAPEVAQHKRRLGIEDLIAAATSADDAAHSKPCPDVFEAALADLGDVAPDAAIVVGDTPYDAIAARRAGVRMIGVLCGGFTEQQLRAAGVIEIYRDPADLLARYEQSVLARERRTPRSV